MRLIALLVCGLAMAPAASGAEITLVANPLGDPGHALHLGDYARLDRWAVFKADCYHHRDSLTGPEAAVLVSGRIEDGDLERFLAAIEPVAGAGPYGCPNLVVMLDSGGGALLEAIRLGRAVAERGLATVVPPGSTCLSACVFLLAGGSFPKGAIRNTAVFAGARVGLHQPQFDLSERQRAILAAAPNAPDLAYSLAGAQWTEIYDYLVNARRNPHLLQLMLASPPDGATFNELDSFEELYLAGMRLVAPGRPVDAPTGGEALSAATARHVCALPMIRDGANENFAEAPATLFDGVAIVGLPIADRFCIVTRGEGFFSDDPSETETLDVCYVGRGLSGELPAYVEQFGYGAMGNNPVFMFDHAMIDQFAIDGETADETRAAIAAFLQAKAAEPCETRDWFYVADLAALGDGMWIDPDCPAATRLCETGRPFAENLRRRP